MLVIPSTTVMRLNDTFRSLSLFLVMKLLDTSEMVLPLSKRVDVVPYLVGTCCMSNNVWHLIGDVLVAQFWSVVRLLVMKSSTEFIS